MNHEKTVINTIVHSEPEEVDMEVAESRENDLLSDSASEVPSCSSSILNTPKNDLVESDSDDDGINVTIKPISSVIFRSAIESEINNSRSLSDSEPKIKWRKNMSKGQRNKMKKCLEAGLNKHEARKQVFSNVTPGTPNTTKRLREGEQGSSEENPNAKRTKENLCPKMRAGLISSNIQDKYMKEKETVKNSGKAALKVPEYSGNLPAIPNSTKHSYRDAARMVKMGILVKDYPNHQMTTEQLDALQEAILLKIENQRHEKVKPKFTKCSYRHGYLVLDCKDSVTANWLKDVTGMLSPWENAELIALDEKDIPRPEVFHAFFPLSADYSDERLRGLIESQNDGLSTKGWRILTRSNANKHAEWMLNVDEGSLEILSQRNFILNFRFGETQLRKVKYPGQRHSEITATPPKGNASTVGAKSNITEYTKEPFIGSSSKDGQHSTKRSVPERMPDKMRETRVFLENENDRTIASCKGKEKRSLPSHETD
ncbi:uncharacterized protein LOC134289869 [Aedes albopictus]|uniref:DUF4780 domain-containing protein n=1 Tax=Aedes albopictus TaxID=7160 RepID=A0ABM1YD02_AEDAL